MQVIRNRAIKLETDKLNRAAQTYRKALGLACTQQSIKFTSKVTIKEGEDYFLYTEAIFAAITDTLINKRKDRICSDEIAEFMKSIGDLKSRIEELEDYAGG